MIYGYARVWTNVRVAAQVAALRKHRAGKVFREMASGAKSDRAQLRRLLLELGAGDVLTVTRLDRLARSTRDLLNTLAAITDKKAGFRSLGDTADHGSPGTSPTKKLFSPFIRCTGWKVIVGPCGF
jgi:DNA invertase Pin-like site-specific DNA recombinase